MENRPDRMARCLFCKKLKKESEMVEIVYDGKMEYRKKVMEVVFACPNHKGVKELHAHYMKVSSEVENRFRGTPAQRINWEK